VDEIVELWKQREPDVDATSLHVVGRLLRAAAEINRVREDALRQFGLTVGDFDVLATLRRVSGPCWSECQASVKECSHHLGRDDNAAGQAGARRVGRAPARPRRSPGGPRPAHPPGQQSAGDAVRAVLSAHDDYLRGPPRPRPRQARRSAAQAAGGAWMTGGPPREPLRSRGYRPGPRGAWPRRLRCCTRSPTRCLTPSETGVPWGEQRRTRGTADAHRRFRSCRAADS
jgi:hypothetical protein